MSVPQLQLNKRAIREYQDYDISCFFQGAVNSTPIPLPIVDISTSEPASNVYDYSFWEEASTTLVSIGGGFMDFPVPDTDRCVVQVWLSMYCGSGEPRGVGIGIRWYDGSGNILLSEGTYQKYPRQDSSYIQFISSPPAGAVEGRTIWGQSGLPGLLAIQWGTLRSSYIRQITSWNT